MAERAGAADQAGELSDDEGDTGPKKPSSMWLWITLAVLATVAISVFVGIWAPWLRASGSP
jgi:hypothetical protein